MRNEFIPYEQALELKELGFDEPCFGKFYYNHLEIGGNWSNDDFKEDPDIFISAPLYQQVFKWFCKKHNLYAVIMPTITMYWTFKTVTVVEGIVEVPPYNHVDANDYPTYEEAEIESVKELILIVKNYSINDPSLSSDINHSMGRLDEDLKDLE
jgi:hypothetical protein